MNPLVKTVMAAGQRAHEQLYGSRLQIFGVEVPCNVTGLMKDFTLVEGGQSVHNMIETLSFRVEELQDAQDAAQLNRLVPGKENFIAVLPSNSTEWLLLKLGSGGLDASGLIYRFSCFDRDYAA